MGETFSSFGCTDIEPRWFLRKIRQEERRSMNNLLTRMTKCAALIAIGGTALMQASEQATFHLSVVTHWGHSVLQPGDYKMSLPDDPLGERELKVEGNGRTVYIFPIVADSREKGGSSHLELTEVNGQYYVHGFASGVLGKEFTFYTPKAKHHEEIVAKDGSTSTGIN